MRKKGFRRLEQKGAVSLLYFLIILAGLVIGVIIIESGTRFFSNAWDVVGPSKSAILKIPFKSPLPSQIASASAKPTASASASASVKPQATASASVKPSPSSGSTLPSNN